MMSPTKTETNHPIITTLTPPPPSQHQQNHELDDVSATEPSTSQQQQNTAAAFIAGERAAYARAFAAVLPAQQALGQLFQSVESLQKQLETEAASLCALQQDATRHAAALSRIDAIETVSIPSIQSRIDGIASRPTYTPELVDALHQLHTSLATAITTTTAATTTHASSSSSPALYLLKSLADTATGYATSALSKADVAAVFLSRKILLGDVLKVTGNGTRKTNQFHAVGGAALFVSIVEAAWQLNERIIVRQMTPRGLRSLHAPVRRGLGVVRIIVWISAFVLAATEIREACHNVFSSPPPPETQLIPTVPMSPPYSPSLAPTLDDITQGRAPPPRPHSRGSPAPARELLKDNSLFANEKKRNNDDDANNEVMQKNPPSSSSPSASM